MIANVVSLASQEQQYSVVMQQATDTPQEAACAKERSRPLALCCSMRQLTQCLLIGTVTSMQSFAILQSVPIACTTGKV